MPKEQMPIMGTAKGVRYISIPLEQRQALQRMQKRLGGTADPELMPLVAILPPKFEELPSSRSTAPGQVFVIQENRDGE